MFTSVPKIVNHSLADHDRGRKKTQYPQMIKEKIQQQIVILRPDRGSRVHRVHCDRGLFNIILTPQNPGVLTIFTDHPGGNLVH